MRSNTTAAPQPSSGIFIICGTFTPFHTFTGITSLQKSPPLYFGCKNSLNHCFIHLVHAAMEPRHRPVFQHLNNKCKRAGMGRSQMAPGMTGWSRDIPSFTLSRSTVWNRLKKLPADRIGPANPFQSSRCPQQLAAFLTSNQQYQRMDKHREDLSQLSLEHHQGAEYKCRRLAWQNPNSSVLQPKTCSH